MTFRHYRTDAGWHYGWTGDRWWLSVCRDGLTWAARIVREGGRP